MKQYRKGKIREAIAPVSRQEIFDDKENSFMTALQGHPPKHIRDAVAVLNTLFSLFICSRLCYN